MKKNKVWKNYLSGILCILCLGAFAISTYADGTPGFTQEDVDEWYNTLANEIPELGELMSEVAETETEKIVAKTDILFRGVEWGTEREALLQSETQGFESSDYTISDTEFTILKTDVAGHTSTASYYFNEDGLLMAGAYSLLDTYPCLYPSINNYYYDYTDLVEKLIDKYGTPTEQEENWVDEKFKYDPEQIGSAIWLGHVFFSTTWVDKNSNILTIYCDAEGYTHPQVYLIYTSPYYSAEAMSDNGL